MRETKKYQPLVWLMAVLSFVIVLSLGSNVQASQIDKAPFVDSVVLDKTEAFSGESLNIKIEFSEKDGHKFAPGNEMVFDLPKELEGFKTSMLLEDYAIVTVEAGRATVKFTDKVALKEHVKGKLSFNLKVSDSLEKDSEKTIDMSFGTKVQNSLKVKGHKTPTGTPGRHEPAYKGGFVDVNDPTVLNWYVVVNANMDQIVGDVYVTDTLGAGHDYIPNSFKITGNPNVAAPKVKVWGNKHRGRQFEVNLPEKFVSGTSVGITYQTRLDATGEKMKELTNKFATEFATGYNNPKSTSGGARLANLLMSGKIEGDDGIKNGTEGTVEPMPEETVEPIVPIEPENGQESVEENHLEDGVHGTQPDIHNIPKVEELPVDEDTEEIAPIEPENGTESIEKNHEDGIHGTQPEIHNVPKEETLPEDESIGEIDPIESDKGQESIEENHLEDGTQGTQPELHIGETEEVNPEETVDVIDPITPEHVKSTPVEEDKVNPIVTASDFKSVATKTPVQKQAAETKPAAESAELPKTGSVDHFGLTIIGLLGLLFTGFVMTRRK